MCVNQFSRQKKVHESFSRLSRHFSDLLKNIQTIRKLSRLSEKNFRTIRKISRLSGNCPDSPETFQTIQNFPDNPETFQIVRKFSRLSKNFPDRPKTSQCNFKGYAQTLSSCAKTFLMTIPRCYDGFWDSARMKQQLWLAACLFPFGYWVERVEELHILTTERRNETAIM